MQETEKVRLKVFCTQDEFWQPAVEINTQRIGEPKNLEVHEEMPDKTQLQINEFIVDGNLAEEPKAGLLREELEFKRKLNELQLEAAAREVEIKNAVLEQVKDGAFSLSNLFGVQNIKKV
ncbi:hypothetical protein HW555_013337 [Spodoptera exigua]|uniref:Uncharacterized protein n=1 Tax=Spodoptera exigua TaxID=7107 RepID=A0A835G3L2_SPOEX|nr:hypothetical protein HW555_013337 [Spodoptera exigua]